MEFFINVFLLALIALLAVAIARLRELFAAVMIFGIFSLLSAALFVVLDAVDVAFTEAAVGAGISIILMLATLAHTNSRQKAHPPRIGALAAAVFAGALLVYGTLDNPPFGDPSAPAHRHVAPHYLEESGAEIGIPNAVTSVLASYRGYDTLGETTVIFTAGVAVLALMGGRRRRRGGRD